MALTSGAVVLGRTGPGALEALGVGICDGAPCFMGILPGVTRWEDARAILAKNGGYIVEITSHAAFTDVYYSIHHLRLTIDYYHATGHVTVIYIEGETGAALPVTAGDVIRYLGLPCSALIGDTPQQLSLGYPGEWLDMRFIEKRLSLYSPVTYIGIQGSGQNCVCGGEWRGFAKSDQYRLCPLP